MDCKWVSDSSSGLHFSLGNGRYPTHIKWHPFLNHSITQVCHMITSKIICDKFSYNLMYLHMTTATKAFSKQVESTSSIKQCHWVLSKTKSFESNVSRDLFFCISKNYRRMDLDLNVISEAKVYNRTQCLYLIHVVNPTT